LNQEVYMPKICKSQEPFADASAENINAWIKQFTLWCTAQDEALVWLAFNLIKNQELSLKTLLLAKILAEITLDANLLAAGLVYESFSNGEISNLAIKTILGSEVNSLVLSLQKIDLMLEVNSTLDYKIELSEIDSQILGKMIFISEKDPRVIVIKLLIHLCAMRLSVNSDESTKLKLAGQVQKLFAPLSKHLNLPQINWELEDLAFKFLQPDMYKKIAILLDKRRIEREVYILEIKQKLKKYLELHGIEAEVHGRPKHIYSIWVKMQRKLIDYNAIQDLHALRVIVPHVMNCYTTLVLVHTLWQSVHQSFTDYISKPKSNGYESLHTNVTDSDGRILEVQIRTRQMHQQAESGIAAHWRYKDISI